MDGSRVQCFFKLTLLHEVFERQKISKTILEKAFLFFFLAILYFLVLVSKNIKIGLSER